VSCPEIGLHIKVNKMDKKKQMQILYDHEVNGLSYRNLGKKYGMNHSTIYSMISSKEKGEIKAKEVQQAAQVEEVLPGDVKALKAELVKARLKIEMLELVINISSKELGIDLRKKRGARRS
jgi:transposase